MFQLLCSLVLTDIKTIKVVVVAQRSLCCRKRSRETTNNIES